MRLNIKLLLSVLIISSEVILCMPALAASIGSGGDGGTDGFGGDGGQGAVPSQTLIGVGSATGGNGTGTGAGGGGSVCISIACLFGPSGSGGHIGVNIIGGGAGGTYPGGDGGNGSNGGGGGGGGIGNEILTTGTNQTTTVSIPIQGGKGGNGDFSSGGGGGGGGGWGLVIINAFSGGRFVINANATAGAGGSGGNAMEGTGGGGGFGGVGVFVSGASGGQVTNNATITGGSGGNGGGAGFFGFAGQQGSGGPGMMLDSIDNLTINNNGTILGGNGLNGGAGIFLNNTASNININNIGTIQGGIGSIGINNNGTITTLQNLQGAGNNAGPLTFAGNLPTNYNIIINSTSQFGRLAVTNVVGNTTFGISVGSVTANNFTYTSVLRGVTPVQLGSATTSFTSRVNGFTFTLTESDTISNIWDLTIGGTFIPAGPSTADTQTSLVNTASVLKNAYVLQNYVLAIGLDYDCTLFDVNNICISAGGRNTTVSAANGLNNTAAILIAAYRPHQNYRLGAWVDQNLSMNNQGSTVSLGNNTPMVGFFGAWNQNPKFEEAGAEVKVSLGVGQKNTTITRQVVGTSEAGTGSSQLNSQGAQVIAKYGFGVAEGIIMSPYLGMRYTQNNMGGYKENTSTSVTAPLSYSALNTNATTALVGLGSRYRVNPTVTLFGSAGVEADTNTSNGSFYGTNSTIVGLTPVNFNSSPVKTRPTATVGSHYYLSKQERLSLSGVWTQTPWAAVSSTTFMLLYTAGI